MLEDWNNGRLEYYKINTDCRLKTARPDDSGRTGGLKTAN